jgi:hypothetical protein
MFTLLVSTAGTNGQTLKMIFESETIQKVFFDVRNDSDALYYHFGISLAGVHDIQVMEFAVRTPSLVGHDSAAKVTDSSLADADGRVPLLEAAHSGNEKIILLLLEHGADPARRKFWTACRSSTIGSAAASLPAAFEIFPFPFLRRSLTL